MQYFLLFVLISSVVQLSVAPPVNQKAKDGQHDGEDVVDTEQAEYALEYRRYLTEVVQVLESDPEFLEKLNKADEADIRTGKIAEQLQFVNHNVRSLLDEVKRRELERLRHLATRENELQNGLDVDHLKGQSVEHLDHTNTRTFEIQDLKKLIAKTTSDLAEVDRTRRQEFKMHEMEKKYEEQEKLKKMNDEEKKKYEDELHALKEKQKKHEPVHHPGSKQQLEEVWEKQDHMDSEDFNPKTFFFLHDIDGNGFWDQDEVKALFLKELDKLYAQGTPKDDVLKRAEEMERMREHVFIEADLNKDGLISYEEFLEQTKKPDFQRDEGWQGLDEQQLFTEEEFEQFEKLRQSGSAPEIMDISQHNNIPAQHEPMPPQYAQVPVSPQQYADPRGPNQNLPHQQYQEHPQQYHQQPQVSVQQQQIHGQIPQQQYPQMQVQHPSPVQQGQVPVQQHQGQVPLQQHQGQVPVQQHQGQVPVQQHQGQVPVQQHEGQFVSPQHGQIPIQQNQGQLPVQQQQNMLNQVPQGVQNNAIPQQNGPSQPNLQPMQANVHQDVNNKI